MVVAKKRVMGGWRLVTVRKSKDKGPTEFGALIYIYYLLFPLARLLKILSTLF